MKNNNTSNQISKAGQVVTKPVKGGIQFWAYNHERGEDICIGTQRDQVFEKVAVIFRQRQTFNLTRIEYLAILETGARFINIVLPDKSRMYSIGVERFARYAQPYEHPRYGDQLACPVKYFSPSNEVSPRTARRDNPPVETSRDIIEERRQLSFFG